MTNTILITGGTGKVGKQLVEHFYKNNYTIVFTSRTQENIDKLINKRKNIYGIKVDLELENAVDTILKFLNQKELSINYLINNARSLDALKVEDDGTILDEYWHREYQIDVVLSYKLSLALSKIDKLKKIINISSVYGISSFNPHLYEGEFKPLLQYACAKSALIQLTKCLAVLFAEKNIAVNCVTYGGIEGRVNQSFKNRYAELCPQKRMMKEEEVIGAVDFLINENSKYITGQNIIVDGGWTIW